MRAGSYCLLTLMVISTLGCGLGQHKLDYTPPQPHDVVTSVTVAGTKDEVWAKLVPALSKTFFVINNIDKDSGLINVSYAGDPEQFIDCGKIYSSVHDLAGERVYHFPAATAYKEYEYFQHALWLAHRRMHLDGRVNIVVEEKTTKETTVSVNVNYIVQKTVNYPYVASGYGSYPGAGNNVDTISFIGDKTDTFAAGTICRSKGSLEKQILDLVSNDGAQTH